MAIKQDSPIKIQTLKVFLDAGHKLGILIGWHYTDQLRLLLDDPKYQTNIVAVPKFDKKNPSIVMNILKIAEDYVEKLI
ncbi:MAG: hypothetical protein QF493_07055 [Rhodospirillales bacterium]|nr:hypothetical protein [Rhodospirillales bacterium]